MTIDQVRTASGSILRLEPEQSGDRGGEGSFRRVAGDPDRGVKLYGAGVALAEKERKIAAMVAAPVRVPAGCGCRFAWPEEAVFDPGSGAFCGYLMATVQGGEQLTWFEAESDRAHKNIQIDRRGLYAIAHNVALAVAAVHGKGHAVIDLHGQNIYVDPSGAITFIDTDSFFIQNPNGAPFRTDKVKQDAWSPEFLRNDLNLLDQEHDRFALAMMIFRLLMNRDHPFRRGNSSPVDNLQNGSLGLFSVMGGHPNQDNFEVLHDTIKTAFKQTFKDGHQVRDLRTAAKDWQAALKDGLRELMECASCGDWYEPARNHCPSCLKSGGSILSIPLSSRKSVTPNLAAARVRRAYRKRQLRKYLVGAALVSVAFLWLSSGRACRQPGTNQVVYTPPAEPAPPPQPKNHIPRSNPISPDFEKPPVPPPESSGPSPAITALEQLMERARDNFGRRGEIPFLVVKSRDRIFADSLYEEIEPGYEVSDESQAAYTITWSGLAAVERKHALFTGYFRKQDFQQIQLGPETMEARFGNSQRVAWRTPRRDVYLRLELVGFYRANESDQLELTVIGVRQ